MPKRAFVSNLDMALKPHRRFPHWAWGVLQHAPNADGFYVNGSALAHVNRRYHWHMGRLWFLLRASDVLGERHGLAVERIIRAEMRDATNEFNAWKKANGYV